MPIVLHSHKHLFLASFPNFSVSSGSSVVSLCVFKICTLLMTKDLEHFFLCLLGVSKSSLRWPFNYLIYFYH